MSTTQAADPLGQEKLCDRIVIDKSQTTNDLPLAGQKLRRMLSFSVVLVAIIAVTIGIRLRLEPAAPRTAIVSMTKPITSVPTNPAVEAVWGIRFTNVIVLADNGAVELRYLALNDSTSAKLHQGTATSNQLPSIAVEGTNSVVAPSAVLMHFHHGDITVGRSYSIIYGNAGGVVTAGKYVAIVMKDGLKIEHIEVSN